MKISIELTEREAHAVLRVLALGADHELVQKPDLQPMMWFAKRLLAKLEEIRRSTMLAGGRIG
jgi:hypothetical protein